MTARARERRARWTFALVASLFGCARQSPPPAPPAAPAQIERTRACHYDVGVHDPSHMELEVHARCDGDEVIAFEAAEGQAAAYVKHVVDGHGRPIARDAARFTLPKGAPHAISYRIDLDAVAAEAKNADVCLRTGDAWIAAGSTFLLQPIRPHGSTAIHVHVSTPPDVPFSTGMRRSGEGYRMRAAEISQATYSIFGRFDREEVRVPGPLSQDEELRPLDAPPESVIEIVTLPGHLAVRGPALSRWVREAAMAVSDFWRGFPIGRTLLVIIPREDYHTVVHGKVVSAGGPSVVIHLGGQAHEQNLYRDWILIHEFFHLGVPSFVEEGKWLDEGLATYFEPIIRARAGWRSERAVWREFAFDMDQGLDAVQEVGVELDKSYRGIYWGGAIIALLADVRTRARTEGRLGLEDGLRAVLARGGDASQVWSLEEVIGTIDETLGAPTLASLAEAHAYGGKPIDFYGLLRELGVTRLGTSVALDNRARLASVRRSILEPPL